MVSLSTATTPRRPGIMLVGPRLKEPSDESAATFLRWTKLHFRDMLNMPDDPSLGKMTRALRFAAPADNKKYSFDPENGYSPYFYTLHIDDLGVVQSEPYYAVSRRLDLEKTRALGKDEEPVGQEGFVFDIVDAKFAIFEEVASAVPMNSQVGSYQNLPLPPQKSQGRVGSPLPTYLVALSIKSPESDVFAERGLVPPIVLGMQASLLSHFSSFPQPQDLPCKVYTSLYRHAGKEAQPADHPEIDCEASGEWLVVVLLALNGGWVGTRDDVEGWTEQWAEAVRESEKAVNLNFGVWHSELSMQ